MLKRIPKYQLATAVAVLFHSIGLAGILFFDRDIFISLSPLNLLLSFCLLLWTQPGKNMFFFLFLLSVISIAFTAELIGVHTGYLFGVYKYKTALGFKLQEVPLLIGFNWFIIIYCCGISMQTLLLKTIRAVSAQSKEPAMLLKGLSVIIDGATLAVVFDWLMEPAAVKLGFWEWLPGGEIPLLNYISWFIVSLVLMSVFHLCQFKKQNKFAINLLLVQAMFFLLLRTFMN